MGARDLLQQEPGVIGGISLGGALEEAVEADQHHPSYLGPPRVGVLRGEEVVGAIAKPEGRGEGRWHQVARVVGAAVERHQVVPDERRVDRDQVDLSLPGTRRDEAQVVVVVTARVDQVQRVAEHAQEPGAAAAGGAPDPDDPRLELLGVEVKPRHGGVPGSASPRPPKPHLAPRSVSSSDSRRRAYARSSSYSAWCLSRSSWSGVIVLPSSSSSSGGTKKRSSRGGPDGSGVAGSMRRR